ncbi:nitrogen fixation negative regulator NifL [Vibrio sp. M260118]|uniref:nitrogen fixation negative regulator NifL n=1 Tax=Vibrio sp. M260118 TaxID=3020896 RepID=UPI002F3F6469
MIQTGSSELSNSPQSAATNSTSGLNSAIFEHIVMNAQVALTITDHQGNICDINDHFLQVTGYSKHELIGNNCSMLSYNTTPKAVYEELWQTIKAGETWQGQLINRRKDGSLYIADLTISHFKSDSGEVFYYATHKDITQQHQQNIEQRNQEAIFQQVLSSAPISIALVDSNNRVIFGNKKYFQLAELLEGDPTQTFVDKLIDQKRASSIAQYLGDKKHRTKTLNITSNKREYWLDYILANVPISDISTEAYFDDSSSYCTVIGIIDRTKEKQRVEEKRLNTIVQMTNDNKYVHTMQEVMMAMLHQLQGPINMIGSATTILKQANHSCPGLAAMDDAMASANLALSDIKQAVPERNREAIQPVNINQLLSDSLAISTKELLEASVEVELRLAPELSCISGKPYRLLLAFKQLIENSVDELNMAKNDDRQLLITSKESDDEVIVSIEDSGRSIEPELRHKIFQPFYSTKPTTSSGCHGIGLAIVQQVVNEHSASIEVESSRRLRGSVFRLIFPKIDLAR